ncbi:alpha/beta fold hydrolase [Stutzerimonas kirkiae]|uniref:alpha/beta fold hydrolase n=1 Tax=Stutzerimonas kirkiae TaxID=2211392 RepID=UPI00103857A7|nr:alpha/beta hydrolase [Stutzerimonas kirkiae]TBV09642.1 alkyl salicylate esterase [Stutzerimonas kirkiae]
MTARHIVLIHGAWAGSWVWEPLLPALRAAGFEPHAVDLPGNRGELPFAAVSLERYRGHVLAVLESLDGPAHLVAHSGGGVTATAVAEAAAERIASVTYIAGMMLPSGMGFGQLCAQLAAEGADVAGIGPYLEVLPGASRVPPAAAREIFLGDVADEAAWHAARCMVAQPDGGRDIVADWSAERFGRLPRLYVEALDDRSVTLPAQRRMQELTPGAQRLSLACGHVPQLAAPDALLEGLLAFFARI